MRREIQGLRLTSPFSSYAFQVKSLWTPMRTSTLIALRAASQVLILCSLLCTTSASAAAPRIERKILQVEQSLLQFDPVNGQELAPTPLAARMATLRVPGVSIAMIHNGRIEWAKGFGVTRTDGPAVSPRTLFQAASISQPITALEVLRLVQSGRLDLDTDVNEYLKRWKIPPNAYTGQTRVTLRQLLSHRAGTTVRGFPGYSVGADLPTLIQILDGQAPANTAAIRVDVQRALADNSNRVLSAAMTREMLTPDADHLGLGLHVDGNAKHRYFEHEGANAGYRCELVIYERGDGVVVMTNSDSGDQLVREIVRTLARAYGWPDFQPSSH